MVVGRRRALRALADSLWPATSGGQIRSTPLHRALESSDDVRSVAFRIREPVDPAKVRRCYREAALDAAVTGALDDVLPREAPFIANRTAT